MATFLMGAEGRHFLGEIIFAIVSSRFAFDNLSITCHFVAVIQTICSLSGDSHENTDILRSSRRL